MLKFTLAKAGTLDPETTVITRVDGKSMKDDAMYLIVNLNKPHGKEVYEVLKRYGYDIPEVQRYLNMLPTFGQTLETIALLLKPIDGELTPVFAGNDIKFLDSDKTPYGIITRGSTELSLFITGVSKVRSNYQGHQTNRQLSSLIRQLNKETYIIVQSNLLLLDEPKFITGNSTSQRKKFQDFLKENGLANYDQFKEFCNLDLTEYC